MTEEYSYRGNIYQSLGFSFLTKVDLSSHIIHLPKLVQHPWLFSRDPFRYCLLADIEIVALIFDWKNVTISSILHHLFTCDLATTESDSHQFINAHARVWWFLEVRSW